MVNCAFENFGCDGGYILPAIDFLVTEGVAPYECSPYTGADTQGCHAQCSSQQPLPYQKYYCKGDSMKVMTNVD